MPLFSKPNTHRLPPNPLIPSPSVSTLVEKSALEISGFWNMLVWHKRFFFLLSCDSYQILCVTAVLQECKKMIKMALYMGQCSCFKADVEQLEQVRENTYKESKIQGWLYLLKARQQSVAVRPRPVLSQIPAAVCPVTVLLALRARESRTLQAGKHPVWDVEFSCSFFTSLHCESKTRKGASANCRNHQCLRCYPIVCFAL